MTKIRKGLTLPIKGQPKSEVDRNKSVKSVAILGSDYQGMKPTMLVKEGDEVKIGQALFECKRQVGVKYTAPAAGKVVSLNRGPKRVFESLVIQISSSEEQVEFSHYKKSDLDKIGFEKVRDLLQESGLWTALRTRPYSKNPLPESRPKALFITAIDTNPLSGDPISVINSHKEDFKNGVKVLSKLTEGKTYVCHAKGESLPVEASGSVNLHGFEGPHPAGNVGTHIHFLDPAHADKPVWHIGYQDCIAVGKLFSTGKLWTERVVALGGPQARNPRLLVTRVGASLGDLLKDEYEGKDNRVISGSVFNGHHAKDTFNYLGRYHNQISLLKEGKERELLGWGGPGLEKFSVKPSFISKLLPAKLFDFTTSTHGSPRAMVPTGNYEDVMPMDILATQLLRSLITKQTDLAQKLGCMELDEEDLALCTFVDHGKVDYGTILRDNLTIIEKE